MNLKDLIGLIDIAFDNDFLELEEDVVPYGKEEYSADYAEVKRLFQGNKWKDIVDQQTIRSSIDPLWLLTPSAFRYYLAAFLLSAILENDESIMLPEHIFSLLTPSIDDFKKSIWLQERINGFSQIQIKTITEVIRYMLKHFPDISVKSESELLKVWAQLPSS